MTHLSPSDATPRDQPNSRALRALLINCRLDLETLRREVPLEPGAPDDDGLSGLEARMRRLLRRLETATESVDEMYKLATTPDTADTADTAGLLSREADLRVRTSLRAITTMLEKQARQAEGVEARQALRAATARIDAVTQVHDSLQNHVARNGAVELGTYLTPVCDAIGHAFGAAEAGISLRVELQPLAVQPDTARSIGIIVTELVTNAVRHAFPARTEGAVRVSGETIGSCYRLCVEDDGVGLPQHGNSPLAPRMGLVLVNALAAQLRAPLLVDVARGTSYSLALPM